MGKFRILLKQDNVKQSVELLRFVLTLEDDIEILKTTIEAVIEMLADEVETTVK